MIQYKSKYRVKDFIDILESRLNIDVLNTFKELSKFKYDEDISNIDTSGIDVYYLIDSDTGCINAVYTKLGEKIVSCDVSSPDIVFDISTNNIYEYIEGGGRQDGK